MAVALPPPVPAPVATHGPATASGNLLHELEVEAQALADFQREESGFLSNISDESRPAPQVHSPSAITSHSDRLLMQSGLEMPGQDLTEMLSRLEGEGQQLASWGATLHREHTRLERENVELEVRAE